MAKTILLQVNMKRSWHLLFEETTKVWLPSVSLQLTVECSMSRLRAAYLWLVNRRSIKLSLPFSLVINYPKLNYYCKRWKAGWGSGNEARVVQPWRSVLHVGAWCLWGYYQHTRHRM